jgi:hypothetical protein
MTISRLIAFLALLQFALPSFADERPGEGVAETAARNMIAGIEKKIKRKTKAEVIKMLGAPRDPGGDNFFYDVPVFESDATRITKYNVMFLEEKVFAVSPVLYETVIFYATQPQQKLGDYAGFIGPKATQATVLETFVLGDFPPGLKKADQLLVAEIIAARLEQAIQRKEDGRIKQNCDVAKFLKALGQQQKVEFSGGKSVGQTWDLIADLKAIKSLVKQLK